MHGMLALALCWSAALQQTPLFRSGTELATLEVTVVDGKGHVVTGLGRDDFVITIENRPASVQAVTFVNVDQAAPAVTAPAVTPGASAPAAAPAPTGASAPYRVIVIVVDDLSFPPGPLLASVKPALDLLPLLDTNDLVGLVTTSGLGPVVNPTRDRDAVRKALLDKSSTGRAGREPMGPYFIGAEEAIDIDHGTTQVLEDVADRECKLLSQPKQICQSQIESQAKNIARADLYHAAEQFQAYARVAHALAGGPSPKIMFALTSGMAISARQGELPKQIDTLSQIAAESGVYLYALTSPPTMSDVTDLTPERASARRADGTFMNGGIQTVASATGGEAFLVVGQPKRFLQRIVAETSGFYRLGVQMPADVPASRYARVTVSVKGRDVTVRANHHVIAPTSK